MTTETEGADVSAAEDTTAVPITTDDDASQADATAEAEGDEDETGEDATAATDDKAPKPKKSAKERIDELTAARREAERDVEYWKSRALQPLQQQTPAADQPQASKKTEDKEPDPADYEHGDLDARFIREHATYAARKAVREEMQRERAEEAQRSAQTAWQAKEAAAAAKFPDYREKVTDGATQGRWPCTPDMAAAMRDSELGPDLAYHLASNPDEARRIAGLSPHSQVREIGKLEAKLSAPAAPQAKIKTDAPDPPNVVRGNGGRFEAAPDTDDFSAFERIADKALRA